MAVEPSDRRTSHTLIALCVLFSVLVGLPTLAYRFGRDQAIFAYVGDQWLHGYLPYSDTWDNKPPATYALQALAIAAFGRSQTAPRLMDLLVTASLVLCLFLITRPMAGRFGASVAAMGYAAAYYLHFDYWHSAQAEVPTSLFATLGLLVALKWAKEPRRQLLILTAGASVGMASLFKLTGAFVLPVIVGLIVWAIQGQAKWRRVATSWALLAVGFAVPLLIAGGYFAAHHALADMWDVVIRFNMEYAHQRMETMTLGVLASSVAQALAGMMLVVPLALVGLFAACPTLKKEYCWLLLAWLAVALYMVLAQYRFATFWYHWLAMLPPVAVLAGNGAAVIRRGLTAPQADQRHYWMVIAAVVVGVTLIGTPRAVVASYPNAIAFLTHRMSQEAFDASFTGVAVYRYSEAAAAAAYLQQHTAPSDTVAMWAFEAEVPFLANRRAPSRFVATHPLFDPDLRYKKREWREEFLSDCRAAPPAYFITVNPWRDTPAPVEIADFPALKQFVEQRYVFDRKIGQFKLYRRVAPAAPVHLTCFTGSAMPDRSVGRTNGDIPCAWRTTGGS